MVPKLSLAADFHSTESRFSLTKEEESRGDEDQRCISANDDGCIFGGEKSAQTKEGIRQIQQTNKHTFITAPTYQQSTTKTYLQ